MVREPAKPRPVTPPDSGSWSRFHWWPCSGVRWSQLQQRRPDTRSATCRLPRPSFLPLTSDPAPGRGAGGPPSARRWASGPVWVSLALPLALRLCNWHLPALSQAGAAGVRAPARSGGYRVHPVCGPHPPSAQPFSGSVCEAAWAVFCRVRWGPETRVGIWAPHVAAGETSGTPTPTSCLAVGSPALPGALPA